MRVRIPAYVDRQMMSERTGEVVKVSRRRRSGVLATLTGKRDPVEIAHVKLDISGQTVRVILSDCEAVK